MLGVKEFVIRMLAVFVALVSALMCCYGQSSSPETTRPNILFCISDDQSFPHAGAYGTNWVETPHFDRVAENGILFTKAYTPNAKCAPSRSSILTGRNSWQLEEAANHAPFFPAKFKTFAEVLQNHGYFVGYTGKGWAPGNPGLLNGQKRLLLGRQFNDKKLSAAAPTPEISSIDYAENFKDFLEAKEDGQPFFFWFGATEPHRRYEFGSGIAKAGKKKEDIDQVFEFWPDNDTTRTDLLDYAYEIEYFDDQLGRMLGILEAYGELDNTLIVVTSDNGMPFPRVKGQAYEYSNHLPLAMMWPNGILTTGQKYEYFVSFTDFAPTFLDIASVNVIESGMAEMEGKSLRPIFGQEVYEKQRSYMVIGKERHDVGRPNDVGYPIRGIILGDYLYIKNYEPGRWPAGPPATGYLNCDGSPTKSLILSQRRQNGFSHYWELAFGKRSEEELYNISKDPDCMSNLANDSTFSHIKLALLSVMELELESEGDPRMDGKGHVFDKYLYSNPRFKDFYNRLIEGENVVADWINQSDIEKK